MSYTITISKNEPVTVQAGHEWKQVAEEPMYPGANELAHVKKEIYGYTPEYDKVVEQSREILRQTVETVDVKLVIRAINGLG
jgi:hypothetical protein